MISNLISSSFVVLNRTNKIVSSSYVCVRVLSVISYDPDECYSLEKRDVFTSVSN